MSRGMLFVLTCLVVESGIAWSGDEKSDFFKDLQGQWRGVQSEINNAEAAIEDAKAFRVTVKDDEMTFMTCKGDRCVARKKTFKLDPTKTPMEIDLISLDGAEKGQTQRGIFSIEQGKWRLCAPLFKGERPRDFKTQANDGLMTICLERGS